MLKWWTPTGWTRPPFTSEPEPRPCRDLCKHQSENKADLLQILMKFFGWSCRTPERTLVWQLSGLSPYQVTDNGRKYHLKTAKQCSGTSGRLLRLTVIVGQFLCVSSPKLFQTMWCNWWTNIRWFVPGFSGSRRMHQSWIKDRSSSTRIFKRQDSHSQVRVSCLFFLDS